MRLLNHFLPIFLFSGMFCRDTFSQHKFEFGVSVEPLVVPVNFGTYVESGPGYYDIKGRGKIAQSGSVYFTYWPFTSFGISLGAGIRNFRSRIDYILPDPFYESLDPFLERSYPFSANGWGPSLSVVYRMEKLRGRIGLGAFGLYDQEYVSNSSINGTFWSSGGEVTASVIVDENAYWYTVPDSYVFLQFEGQYNVLDNIFIKCGFETTLSSQHPYPYTVVISGFIPELPPQSQVLNNYKMRNRISSFSFGIGYIPGFGKYRRESDDEMIQ